MIEVDPIRLGFSFVAGLALGAFYFGGLWRTVRLLQSAHYVTLLFFGSFLMRTFVTVGVMLLVTRAEWPNVLVCLVGFWLARVILTRRLGPQPPLSIMPIPPP